MILNYAHHNEGAGRNMTNLDATLVLLYSRLFTSAELSDPLGVSAEILSWLKEVGCTCCSKLPIIN